MNYFPRFIAKIAFKNYPILGTFADVINCLYVERVGDNSKNSKAQVYSQIGEHCKNFKIGVETNPLVIYPEGVTTNGEFILPFKKGAFVNLEPIKICSLKYNGPGEFSSDVTSTSINTTFFILCCGAPNGSVTLTEFPTFAPNEYFWNNHQDIEKEEKWQTYSRVLRKIIRDRENLI